MSALQALRDRLNNIPQFWGDVYDKVENEFEYSVLKGKGLEQLDNTRDRVFGTDPNAVKAGQALDHVVSNYTPVGIAEQGAAILGGNVAETVGAPRVVGEVLGGMAVPGATGLSATSSVSRSLSRAQRAARTVDNVPTPPAGPPAMSPKLALAGQSLRQGGAIPAFEPTMVMPAVTATDGPTLRGVRGGVNTGDDLVTAAQGKRLTRRDIEIEGYRQRIETKNEQMKTLRELRGDPANLEEYIANSDPDLQKYWKSENGDIDEIIERLDGNKKNAQEGLSRTQSNVLPFDSTKQGAELGSMDNVNYFRSKIGLSEKKLEESARQVQGFLEQHHLFPKGMSAAFFNRMDELIASGKATKDDLILMAEYAANQGMRTGDIKANLINMLKDPHNDLHTALRAQGAELSKSDWTRILKNSDNVDDLLVQWRELLAGDVKYNIDTAKTWQPLYDLISDIQK